MGKCGPTSEQHLKLLHTPFPVTSSVFKIATPCCVPVCKVTHADVSGHVLWDRIWLYWHFPGVAQIFIVVGLCGMQRQRLLFVWRL